MAMQRTAFALTALAAPLSVALALSMIESRDALAVALTMAHHSQQLIANGYRAAPALMLGLSLLAIIPAMAIATPLVARARRTENATRRYKAGAGAGEAVAITGDRGPGASRDCPAHAFVEVVGAAETRFAILHDMLRIGREDDNDIRIPSHAVHRYHAAIYRAHSDGWHIADLSGTDGNGIRVNGQRCSDALLSDGDVIDFGPGQLRFRAGVV